MPQLDKTSFYHQIFYVTLALIVLYSLLSFVIMPEVFSSIFTRKFFVVSSKDFFYNQTQKKRRNLKAQNVLSKKSSSNHLAYYKQLYGAHNRIIRLSAHLNKKNEYLDRYWAAGNYRIKAAMFSLKKQL